MSALIAAAIELPSENDGIKLLILVLAAVGVYAFARWASSLGVRNPGDGISISHDNLAPQYRPRGTTDPQEVLTTFPADPALRRLRITKFYFRKLDAIPGPPDPEVFGDELNVELYDPDSGHKWLQLLFVASPKGLAQILRDTSWKYLYAPEMLIVPKYDLEEIRRAVVSRVVETNELLKSGEEREESL